MKLNLIKNELKEYMKGKTTIGPFEGGLTDGRDLTRNGLTDGRDLTRNGLTDAERLTNPLKGPDGAQNKPLEVKVSYGGVKSTLDVTTYK